MKRTFSVLFWVNKNKVNKNTSKSPIFARITVNGKRVELSTGKSIEVKNWISSHGRARGNSEEARTINRYLDNVNVKLTRIFDKMEDADEIITAREFKNRFLGNKPLGHSLIDLFEYHNQQIKDQIGLGYSNGTLERYETTLKHLKEFLAKSLKVNDIDCDELKCQFHFKAVWIWDKLCSKASKRLLVIRKNTRKRKTEIKFALGSVSLEKYKPEEAAYMQAQRFFIEHTFKEAKSLLGLDQFQTRKWLAWYHQVALNMLLLLFLLKEKLRQFKVILLLSAYDIRLILETTVVNTNPDSTKKKLK